MVMMTNNDDLLQQIDENKLIAVVAINDPKQAVPLARALLNGGVKFLEITFRTKTAAQALHELERASLDIIYGAGTVRTADQFLDALDAGAMFMVSPGLNDKLVNMAMDAGTPFIPGVDSTSGIENAVSLGLKVLKFFPAAVSGGVKWLKAMKGPYFDVKFIPTGGVSLSNLEGYLGVSNVLGIGGSFLAPKNLIAEGKFEDITNICKQAVGVVQKVKKECE